MTDDDLAPTRGVLNGLIISTAFWITVALIVWAAL